MICHEHVDEKAASSARPETYAFCNLPAHGWCLDDRTYICEIHLVARHERHRIQSVSDERSEGFREVSDVRDRRSGDERRK
jgi:hypothetical protein